MSDQLVVHRRVIDLDGVASLDEEEYRILLLFTSQWADSPSHPEWRELVELARAAGQGSDDSEEEEEAPKPRRRSKSDE